ncbi:hypothetical protein P7C70_g4845, partial [Phenoliferia sp. Uapishka_3]
PNPQPIPRPILSPESRSLALAFGEEHRLIARPATLQEAIAKAASPAVFDLIARTIKLQVKVADAWYDVLEESWNLAALEMDPMPLRVIVTGGVGKRELEEPSGEPVAKRVAIESSSPDLSRSESPLQSTSSLPAASATVVESTSASSIKMSSPPSLARREIMVTIVGEHYPGDPPNLKCRTTTPCRNIYRAVMKHLGQLGEPNPEENYRVYFDEHDLSAVSTNTMGHYLNAGETEATVDVFRAIPGRWSPSPSP